VTDVAARPVAEQKGPNRVLRIARRTREANIFLVTALAFVVGLAFGAVLIILTTPELLRSWGSFFSHPGGTIALNFNTVFGAYEQLVVGAIADPRAVWTAIAHPSKDNWAVALGPISATLTYATPLTLAGLGLAVGFRTSLFDIGGQGQLIGGAIAATYIGFSVHAPGVVQIPLEILAGVIGGLLVASIAGILKASTGTHEVITTMMMNYIMLFFLTFLLLHAPFQLPGESEGLSKSIVPSGQLPRLLGWLSGTLQVNLGFIIAVAAVFGVSWFLNRSTTGFEFQMVGANPEAARTAGVNSKRVVVMALCIAGALVGLAGMVQVAGIDHSLTNGYGGTIGFDAITVALLGRSKPWGVFLAALLFGGLQAGGHHMQIVTPTNIDYSLALVIEAVIVFCVATPALVVALFKLKDVGEAGRAVTTGAWAS
jgi:simple sugar transport system permease protein